MAGALRKAMVYIGLAEEDDRYDDEGYAEEPERREERSHRARPEDSSTRAEIPSFRADLSTRADQDVRSALVEGVTTTTTVVGRHGCLIRFPQRHR